MTFQHPGALWLLLSIPLLVVLRLFRPRPDRQVLSSTFLWKRTTQFQQQKKMRSRLKKLLMTLLQLLMIASIVLLVAEPILAGVAGGQDEIVLLDTSASMRMKASEQGEESLLDAAVRQILSGTSGVCLGRHMTVLTTDRSDSRLVDRSDSAAELARALPKAVCSWDEGDPEAALFAAQELLRLYPEAEVTLYTDHEVAASGPLKVVNVAPSSLLNASVSEVRCTVSSAGLLLKATVANIGPAHEITLGLYLDDQLTSARTVPCDAKAVQEVQWAIPGVYAFQSAKVFIAEQDALAEDNTLVCFQQPADSAKVTIVSEHPFYLEHAFSAFPGLSQTIYAHPWAAPTGGSNLYVYDGCLPQELPRDGAIWLICPPTVPEGVSGLTLGDGFAAGNYLHRTLEVLPRRELSALLQGIVNEGSVGVSRLREASVSEPLKALLFSDLHPVLAAGRTDSGVPLLVQLFDLHDSNLPLQANLVTLVHNLLAFALPTVLEQPSITVGWPFEANVLPGNTGARLLHPDGYQENCEIADGKIALQVELPGVYRLQQLCEGKVASDTSFFAQIPASESAPFLSAKENYALVKLAVSAQYEANGISLHFPFLVLIILLLLVECVVYNHERI